MDERAALGSPASPQTCWGGDAIEIGGETVNLLLTTKATKAIAARYGGLEQLGDKLLDSDNFEESLDEIVWLLTLLANQSILIHNLRNPSAKRDLLTEEVVLWNTACVNECEPRGPRRNRSFVGVGVHTAVHCAHIALRFGRLQRRYHRVHAAGHSTANPKRTTGRHKKHSSRIDHRELFIRLLYYGTVQMHMRAEEFWLTPFGLFLDLWECHRQFQGWSSTPTCPVAGRGPRSSTPTSLRTCRGPRGPLIDDGTAIDENFFEEG